MKRINIHTTYPNDIPPTDVTSDRHHSPSSYDVLSTCPEGTVMKLEFPDGRVKTLTLVDA